MIKRTFDVELINKVVNHPSIYPWVHGPVVGPLNMEPVVKNPLNFCLWGEFGGVIYTFMQPGLYEAHGQCLPEGRGEWLKGAAQATLDWMFTHTEAVEILTRVPKGNLAARAGVRMLGLSPAFHAKAGWIKDHALIPADVYSMTIQQWIRTCPSLPSIGKKFKGKLNTELIMMGGMPIGASDPEFDRHCGMAHAMVKGNQPHKAATFYNRWAKIASYPEISILKEEPVIMDTANAIVMFKDDNVTVVSCRSLPPS